MARNTLGDLNNHLFEQLERLMDDELAGEQLREEIVRAKAVANIAKEIVETGRLVLDAKKFEDNKMDLDMETPKILEGQKTCKRNNIPKQVVNKYD